MISIFKKIKVALDMPFGNFPYYKYHIGASGLVTFTDLSEYNNIGCKKWKLSKKDILSINELLVKTDFVNLELQPCSYDILTDTQFKEIYIHLKDGRNNCIYSGIRFVEIPKEFYILLEGLNNICKIKDLIGR